MEVSDIYSGYEKYKEYCNKATENAGKKIESIAKYNKLEW